MTFFNWLSSLANSSSSLAERLRNNPYYRLQTNEEIRIAAKLGVKIDVNQAGIDDWLRLPGISIHQARSLVQLTRAGVHFYCVEDLAAVLNQPVQRIRPLEPILDFCYYEAESLQAVKQVNANTATEAVLIQVPVVDLYLARAIVQNRVAKGPYRNLADLQQRLALPAMLTTELLHYLKF